MSSASLNEWPTATLRSLAECIKMPILADGFQLPPDETALDFWRHAATMCNMPIVVDSDAQRLAQEALEALELCDPTCLRPGQLFLSSMSVPASRLAMQRLKLKGCIVIGSAPAQAPKEDEVEYHFFPQAAQDPASAIASCVDFIKRHQPALVCSDREDGMGAVVCAAYFAATQIVSQSSGNVARDGIKQVEVRRGPLWIEQDDLEALDAFCATLPISLRTPPIGPARNIPMPPPMEISTKRSAEAAGMTEDSPVARSGRMASPITPPSKAAAAEAVPSLSKC